MIIISKTGDKTIKFRSIQANSLYQVNNNYPKAFLDLGDAVINDSIFANYVKKHGVTIKKDGTSKDFITIKFDFGVKKVEEKITDEETGEVVIKIYDKMTCAELRDYYYNHDAKVTWNKYNSKGDIVSSETVVYKMLMRGTGQAKDGDCVFVRDVLHKNIQNYITMDLYDKMSNSAAKIVELSAYSTMITATALQYINIPLKNIFIIKDETIESERKAVSVKVKNVGYNVLNLRNPINVDAVEKYINNLGFTFYKKSLKDNPEFTQIPKTQKALIENGINIEDCPHIIETRKECYVDYDNKEKCKNTIWDGMGLIDESIFPEKTDTFNPEGFIYLRSHFFKACLSKGNIQQYFKDWCEKTGNDYETHAEEDMFGNSFLLKDIKVIVTENAIKWTKFTDLMGGTDKKAYRYWRAFMSEQNNIFEIVKTAHKSKYDELQRGSFQMYNSLPTTEYEVLERIAQTSIDYCDRLKLDHEFFVEHLRRTAASYSINNVLLALDKQNKYFKDTEYFRRQKSDIISRYKTERLMLGKLLQNGDNLTLVGNPIALLMKVTGQDFTKDKSFQLIDDGVQCYTTRFKDGECIAGFRSPHNSPNNIVHLVNTYSSEIQKYFPDLGDNVIVVNNLYTDIQDRLNGQDLDTDSIFATNQKDMVKLANQAYMDYPTILNKIPNGTSEYGKDALSYSLMDNKISSLQMAIGVSSNMAQLALSYYYNADGCYKTEKRELHEIFIICSVLAQVAIDSVKREYDININQELARISNSPVMKNPPGVETGKKYPIFYDRVQFLKDKKQYAIKKDQVTHFDCPMDILYEIVKNGVINLDEIENGYSGVVSLVNVFEYNPNKLVTKERKDLYEKLKDTNETRKKIKDELLEKRRNKKNYKRIIEIAEGYDSEVSKLDSQEDHYKDKMRWTLEKYVEKFNKCNVTYGSMSMAIAYAFKNNGEMRNRLLVLLYNKSPKIFLECFKKQ